VHKRRATPNIHSYYDFTLRHTVRRDGPLRNLRASAAGRFDGFLGIWTPAVGHTAAGVLLVMAGARSVSFRAILYALSAR